MKDCDFNTAYDHMMKKILKQITRIFGLEISRYNYFPDISPAYIEILSKVRPYTMTSAERIFSLCEAVNYIHENKIQGDIVECGVWKGGSMMAVAEILLNAGDLGRDLYLFDTFEGMTLPTKIDVDISGAPAEHTFKRLFNKTRGKSEWCYSSLHDVTEALASTCYPAEKLHFVKGMVEQTIPDSAPEKIALLRLDTDWYESTKHEMDHLFPRLSPGGVLIIDDYGHWEGARIAVDEYIKKHNVKILLNRIDYSARIAVKLEQI